MHLFSKSKNNSKSITIKPDPDSDNPDKIWKSIKSSITKKEIRPMPLDTPIKPDHVRFVCMSDTHSQYDYNFEIPNGDVFLHAGDFTAVGKGDEFERFNDFLGTLPHQYKVVIAGNHELGLNPSTVRGKNNKHNREKALAALTNCIYLEHKSVSIFGYNIFGSPYTPRFHNWAFNVDRGASILELWNEIPNKTDILITHGPPLGYGDQVVGGFLAGCNELLNTVRLRVKPQVHLFGHIHEDYGMWTDNTTMFINAACCNRSYHAVQDPVIFDLPLLPGQTKASSSSASLIYSDDSIKQITQKLDKTTLEN